MDKPMIYYPLSTLMLAGIRDILIINSDSGIKRCWNHFDNAVEHVGIVGFDGFKEKYNESYADETLPTLDPTDIGEELNQEIQDIFDDFLKMN